MRTEKLPMASRLLRVREFTDQVTKKTAGKSAGPGRSRFVDPCYFGPEDKAALVRLLAQAGIGDAEGRQLFVTAVEYEIGSLRPALQKEADNTPPATAAPVVQQPPSKADIELLQLGQSAAQLQALLKRTHKTARTRLGEALTRSDPFGREHGPAYLEHLTLELGRISSACESAGAGQPATETEPAALPAKPTAGPAAKKLVRQVARIYDECLEVDPRADQGQVLLAILDLIRDCTGLAIPCDGNDVLTILA